MGHTRILTSRDLPQVRRILDLYPIDNVAVASRVQVYGVERALLGHDLIGYWESDQLISLLSDSHCLFPVNATAAALDAFSAMMTKRRCGSIVGVRDQAIGLWQRLCRNSYSQWASPREVRDHQMVMAISSPPLVTPEMGVQNIVTSHLDSYLAASIAMYTEEVGVSPINPHGSYRDHVASLMMRNNSWAVLQAGKVVFKTDLVAAAGSICQIGGVWLAPALRGRGLSKSLVAAVVAQARQRYSTVCLYVNYYNQAAVRCYAAVGFNQISQCATILY